jgi:ribosomal protein RSM22 (predicted rRNA methylase)
MGSDMGSDMESDIDADLPADLRRGLDSLAEHRSRQELAVRAAALSQRYRSGGRSAEAIRDATDALAYAFARLPATYAAVTAVLAALHDASPAFRPRSLIDAGAGPGTAAWAALAQFDALAGVRLIDDNPHLRELAQALTRGSADGALRDAVYDLGELTARLGAAPAADLVIASYVIGELAPDRLQGVADALWSATGAALVLIEPGTPAGFARIRDVRARLIAHGAHVVAPCPHDGACPIVAPDWCHFARRLARTRDHRQVKGASLAFEDEKFSYVALARDAPLRPDARVLAHPRIGKAEASAKLCTAQGITHCAAARRERAQYRAIKGWRWGDAVTRPARSVD